MDTVRHTDNRNDIAINTGARKPPLGRPVVALGCCILLAVGVVVVRAMPPKLPPVVVIGKVLPHVARISVNGIETVEDGRVEVKPGTTKVYISADGFITRPLSRDLELDDEWRIPDVTLDRPPPPKPLPPPPPDRGPAKKWVTQAAEPGRDPVSAMKLARDAIGFCNRTPAASESQKAKIKKDATDIIAQRRADILTGAREAAGGGQRSKAAAQYQLLWDTCKFVEGGVSEERHVYAERFCTWPGTRPIPRRRSGLPAPR